MATVYSQYPWYPGQNAQGMHILGGQAGAIAPGPLQKQAGQRSFPPVVTSPGTVASAGTVANPTGFDCLVYASAVNGISAVKVQALNGGNATTFTLPGSAAPGQMVDFAVPGPGAAVVSYSGTLTWTWVPL